MEKGIFLNFNILKSFFFYTLDAFWYFYCNKVVYDAKRVIIPWISQEQGQNKHEKCRQICYGQNCGDRHHVSIDFLTNYRIIELSREKITKTNFFFSVREHSDLDKEFFYFIFIFLKFEIK